jgi:hypothetical protein
VHGSGCRLQRCVARGDAGNVAALLKDGWEIALKIERCEPASPDECLRAPQTLATEAVHASAKQVPLADKAAAYTTSRASMARISYCGNATSKTVPLPLAPPWYVVP